MNRTPESVLGMLSSPLGAPTKDASISPVYGVAISDVLLTVLQTNTVSVCKSTSTRIKTIKGIKMKHITITHLRLFAKNIVLQISGN